MPPIFGGGGSNNANRNFQRLPLSKGLVWVGNVGNIRRPLFHENLRDVSHQEANSPHEICFVISKAYLFVEVGMRGASSRFPCIFVLNWWSGRCPWKRCLVVVAIFTTFCWWFMFSRSSFQIGFMFTPILGEMTSIFFRWVGSTTNYRSFLLACDSSCECSLVSCLAL